MKKTDTAEIKEILQTPAKHPKEQQFTEKSNARSNFSKKTMQELISWEFQMENNQILKIPKKLENYHKGRVLSKPKILENSLHLENTKKCKNFRKCMKVYWFL